MATTNNNLLLDIEAGGPGAGADGGGNAGGQGGGGQGGGGGWKKLCVRGEFNSHPQK